MRITKRPAVTPEIKRLEKRNQQNSRYMLSPLHITHGTLPPDNAPTSPLATFLPPLTESSSHSTSEAFSRSYASVTATSTPGSHYPILVKKFLTAVRKDTLFLVPFFIRTCIDPRFAHLGFPRFLPITHTRVDADPFLKACSLIQPGPYLTPKEIREECQVYPEVLPGELTMSQWLSFWKFLILHSARNVWYRVLVSKLPCRATLNRFIPSVVPSGDCIICSTPVSDNREHFLFECPSKLSVWQQLWPSFFDSPFSVHHLQEALFRLKFPASSSESILPPSVYIAHTLLVIWRSHFNFIFNEQPFFTSKVVSMAKSLLLTSSREQLVKLGSSPFPLPYFSI